MDSSASDIIDENGGTSAVARLLHAPVSTVHSWRRKGKIPPSRLAHLRLAAAAEKVASAHSHSSKPDAAIAAPGKCADLAAQAAEARP